MAIPPLPERIETLRTNLGVAADLIGPDIEYVDPEYIRAMVEFTSEVSGISQDIKEAMTDLILALAKTARPEESAAALTQSLKDSADLIGPDIDIVSTNRPDYIKALVEHACLVADISRDHAPAVHDVLVSIITPE